MYESTMFVFGVGSTAFITVYWICLIVGGGLLVISSLSGTDADVGVDGGHAHSSALASWFSIQFVVFFTAVFGAVGVVLSHLTDTGSGATLGTAVAVGLLFGQGAHQLLGKLRRASGDSTPQPADYVNKLAKVTMSFTHPDKGEVVVRVGRANRYVPAVCKHADTSFAKADEVAVVGYQGGVAEVISRKEYEFLTKKD